MERVLKGESKHSQEFLKLEEKFWTDPDPETGETHPAPTQIVAGKQVSDGNTDIRRDAPARRKARKDDDIGPVDVNKSKQKGLDMVNKGTGDTGTAEVPAGTAKAGTPAGRDQRYADGPDKRTRRAG